MRFGLSALFETLPRRLVWLMWATLVGSHLIAFSLVSGLRQEPPHSAEQGPPPPDGGPTSALDEMLRPPPPHGDGPPPGARPVFPSLPPTPGLSQGPTLPLPSLLLDYGVRLLLIALAAGIGARWLSAPLRRLGQATVQLGQALRAGRPAPHLDEASGSREVRQLAHEFNGMAAQLQQAFEARGLMVAAISHDLRTPLTRLRMRLETRLEGDATPARLARLREQAVGDLREMNALIDGVLTVFRPQAALEPAQTLDLRALLQALVDDGVEQDQALELDGGTAMARVQAPPLALRRVLDNLIGNALRHGGGARIRLEAGPCIVIDDDGPGIPEPMLATVFEPFVRVDASRHRASGGVGLGLYIARQLCEAMGVSLALTNRPEGGLRASLRW